MKKWLRRIRGAITLGLTWAVVWAVVAVVVGMIVDPDGSMDEMWPAVGAYPGFLSGVIFSAVLAIAARDRSLDELSLARVGAWGRKKNRSPAAGIDPARTRSRLAEAERVVEGRVS